MEESVITAIVRRFRSHLAVSAVGDLLRRRLVRRSPGEPRRQFDRLLTVTIAEFNDVLDEGMGGRPEGAARAKLKEQARAIRARLEALPPPSAEWQILVNDYLELMALHLEHFGEVLPEDAQRQFAEINHRATIRREALRKAYRSEP